MSTSSQGHFRDLDGRYQKIFRKSRIVDHFNYLIAFCIFNLNKRNLLFGNTAVTINIF